MKTLILAALLASTVTLQAAQGQTAPSPRCDNGRFLADQRAFDEGAPRTDRAEHLCGTVVAVAPARHTRSGMHGFFYLSVGQGVSIRIVSDLDRMNAPAWPWVAKGDQVEVVGRYYFDSPRRQGIDWTHHGTGRTWPVEGFVTVNGTTYR
ncbi:hypothetical protein AA103196_2473 [Ameyamaea chiangmaiensis NBRC 103196]|uniref:hypothetical protein n=1 Tax=Ameyamaea chiangmaiensis TaxID=442969 RepID=UPI00215684FB|nr:hypothetical protein AA103196_2473 [Ameyamaea chiangmaiensis NBRC 103196]